MKFSEIQLPSNKKFGITFSIIFLIISIYSFYKINLIFTIVALSISIIFLLLSFLMPKILFPINKGWMYFGYLLGLIISPIVLGFIFFIIFTPVGILRRNVFKDELLLKSNLKKSYWLNKNQVKYDKEWFRNQF